VKCVKYPSTILKEVIFAHEDTLAELIDNDQILLRYVDNPNGSLDDIAGICNKQRNVVGLMPHPERAFEEILGSSDGKEMISSFASAVQKQKKSSAVSV
jgi:phosphoribosylformylglycinamidine (FGAM) synthase-like amidotransferase family enzyme